MRIIKLIVCIPICILISAYSFGEHQINDSIIQTIYNEKDDTAKINKLVSIAMKIADTKAEQAKTISYDILKLSEKIKYVDGLKMGNFLLGRVFYNLYKSDSAIYYANNAKKFANATLDTSQLIQCLNLLGLSYIDKFLLDSAAMCFFKSDSLNVLINNDKGFIKTSIGFGNIYMKQNEYESAKHYYKKALNKSIKYEDLKGISLSSNNLAATYMTTNQLDSAFFYLYQCKDLLQNSDDQYLYAFTLNNLAYSFDQIGNIDSAIYYTKEAIKIKEKLGNSESLAKSIIALSYQYEKKGNTLEAFNLGEEAFNLDISINQKSIISKYLYELFRTHKKYNKSLDYAILYNSINDSIHNIEMESKVNNLLIKYETAQKEKELVISKAKIEKIKLSRLYISIGSALVLISLIFVYLQYLKKKKAYNVLYQKSIEAVKQEKKNNECRISLNRKQPNQDKQSKLYNNLIKTIEHKKVHHQKGLTLEELAKTLETNREYLSQIINEQYGRFNDFINHYRINDTIEILSDPENKKSKYSLEVIADEVGFKSLSTFITAFKKETGLTPSKFRDSRN